MNGPFENHERVVRTSPRLRPCTDCDPKVRQKCDVLQTMRDVCESVVAHSPDHGGTESRDETEQSHSACVQRQTTGRDRTPLLSTRTSERRDTVPLKAAEGRGPGGLSPFEPRTRTTAREPDYGPWTRAETEFGIGRTSNRVFQKS